MTLHVKGALTPKGLRGTRRERTVRYSGVGNLERVTLHVKGALSHSQGARLNVALSSHSTSQAVRGHGCFAHRSFGPVHRARWG